MPVLATGPLRAQRGHAYWDANIDSLQQVLARPSADTARLRALENLTDRWWEQGNNNATTWSRP